VGAGARQTPTNEDRATKPNALMLMLDSEPKAETALLMPRINAPFSGPHEKRLYICIAFIVKKTTHNPRKVQYSFATTRRIAGDSSILFKGQAGPVSEKKKVNHARPV